MEIGQQVIIHTENMLIPFVVGLNENGKSVEIPVNAKGHVGEIKTPQKKNMHIIGVDFKFSSKGKEQAVRIFFKENSLHPITN